MAEKLSSGQKIARRFTRFSKKASEATLEHVEENIVDRLGHIRRVRLLILEWALLVVSIIFLSLTQAYWYTSSYATETYKNGGTFIEATLGEVKTLNPLFASTNSEKTVAKLLFASLTTNDYTGHSGYNLAKSIKTDKTNKVWTVRLRDNLKWSDGEPLTNEDIIFTANLIKNPLLNSNYSGNLYGVEVGEDEEGNIIFTLPVANVYFMAALEFPILPKHVLEEVSPDLILEHGFSSKPIGCGPYTYNHTQAIGNAGEKAVYLQSNKNYYKGTPKIDSFVVHAFVKSDDIVNALNNGTVTASGELNAGDVARVNSSSLNTRESSLNYGVYAFFNVERVNKDLRKAIQQGIDMGHVRSVLNGERALDYPIIEEQSDLKDLPELPKLDTNTAKKTIKEILSKNEDLKADGITIATVKSGYLPDISGKIAEEIRALGLKVEINAFEPGQDFFLNILSQRNYDILVYEIGLGPNPDIFAYYHSTEANPNGHNLSNYKNVVVSDLVLSARATLNQELRAKKYETVSKYFIEDAPAIGIYQSKMTYFVNKNVKTYSQENRLVTSTDRMLDVEKWGIEKDSKNRTP